MILCLLCWVGLHPPCLSEPVQNLAPTTRESPLAVLKREALALEPLVTSGLARDFLKATANLPAVTPRTVYLDEATKTYKTETAVSALGQEQKSRLKRIDLDDSYYWNTKYGSPLAYARPVDVLGRSGVEKAEGLKILDFGYGTIGHLRLLAAQGASVTGLDVDPLLPALYSAPIDQGVVKNQGGRDGTIRLINGRFPAHETTTATLGGDFDLIISKNTLKKGYVHPERPVDPRRLLNLGVDDATFVRAIHQALKPGGRMLIYNLSPAPSPPGEPYKNWADGRCPFAREVWEAAGFRVVSFDQDDSEAARAIGHALGWDLGTTPIDLKSDLFAKYSLMERRRDADSR